MTGFRIHKRKDTKPTNNAALNRDHDYTRPLCGISNTVDPIGIGDVVGVMLCATATTHVRFEASTKLLSEDQWARLPQREGSYYHREEHFFKIVKIISPQRFFVIPVFIDSDKVIQKEVNENFTSYGEIPTSLITSEVLVEGIFLTDKKNAWFQYPDDDEFFARSYHCVSTYRVQEWCNYWDERKNQTSVLLNDHDHHKKVKSLQPLRTNIPFLFFGMSSDDIDTVRRFYGSLTEHKSEISNILGDDWIVIFGTYEEYIERIQSLVVGIREKLPNAIGTTIEYNYEQYPCLKEPQFHPNITKLKYVEIFRVYKNDPSWKMTSSQTVTNWSGILLPDEIRYQIRPTNLVRIWIKNGEDSHGPYVFILKQLTRFRYLACIRNMYLSDYEDTVFVIDARAITEIPVCWNMNDNFVEYTSITAGPGFRITGLSGFVPTDDLIDVTYDDVIFKER